MEEWLKRITFAPLKNGSFGVAQESLVEGREQKTLIGNSFRNFNKFYLNKICGFGKSFYLCSPEREAQEWID